MQYRILKNIYLNNNRFADLNMTFKDTDHFWGDLSSSTYRRDKQEHLYMQFMLYFKSQGIIF